VRGLAVVVSNAELDFVGFGLSDFGVDAEVLPSSVG